MKKYKQAGKTWKLKDRLMFEGTGGRYYEYSISAYRPVEKGEYFLSGAIPMAYKASNRISYSHLVVVPHENI
jgi:hypothetical protein